PENIVEIEHIRRKRIDLIRAKGLRIAKRHGTPNVVEQRGRVVELAARGADRCFGRERTDAASDLHVAVAFAERAVTARAFDVVDRLSRRYTALASRQTGAVRPHIDVPAGDLFRG